MERVWLGVSTMKSSVTKLIDSDNDGWVMFVADHLFFFLQIARYIVTILADCLVNEYICFMRRLHCTDLINTDAFYPRDAMLARVIEIATCLLSLRPSLRLSVTRRYCVKTKKASGMISSPSGSPKTLVFWRQISSPNSKCFPPNGGLKQGWGEKIQRSSSFKR